MTGRLDNERPPRRRTADSRRDDGADRLRAAERADTAATRAAAGSAAAEAEIENLRQSLAEAEQRHLRLAADFENFKRRKLQELEDRSRYASEEAARAMLPVLDNLRRAVDHAPEEGAAESLVNGLRLVVREFDSALERLGVTRVSGVGEAFDPSVHEAIAGEESDAVEADTVIDELVPGYRLHDRLLRPAVVRVAHPRHPAPAG